MTGGAEARARAWGLAAPLAWMAAIYLLSDQPQLPAAPLGWLDWAVKKGLHAAGYAVLALLWRRALAGFGAPQPALAALAIAVGYAALDEWHQTFVPGRHGRLADVAIDAAGALAALRARATWPRGP